MKNSKFTILQQKIQQHRRSTSSTTFEDTEFKMTPQRKKFLDMLERQKQENQGDEK
jgi:Fe2+ or Zn2+ uptake regulation protein